MRRIMCWGACRVAFLNACGTGVRDPRKTSDLVREFMSRGGRGVLATECDVPDAFASVFVQRVYDRVLEGETFGRALLAARRYFWERHHNPLGLLYAAYTRLETRIVTGEGPGQGEHRRASERYRYDRRHRGRCGRDTRRAARQADRAEGGGAGRQRQPVSGADRGDYGQSPGRGGRQFKLTEFTISAEISAKGSLSLLGTGGEMGGKGGLTFKFTRKS